jgi:hypothetical protein
MSEQMDIGRMSLQQIQAELKEESPLRDAARRQQLWKRLDRLVARRIERDDPDDGCVVLEVTCSPNPADGAPVGDGYRARVVGDEETAVEPSAQRSVLARRGRPH